MAFLTSRLFCQGSLAKSLKSAFSLHLIRCSSTLKHEGIEVTMTDSPRPKIHEQVKSPSDIAFGKHFSDHMLLCHWDREAGWEKPKIVPYGDIPMSPALSALHYATECFEGMKAYRGADGKIRLFRPMENMNRMKRSAVAASLPDFEGEEFLECIKDLLRVDREWVPKAENCSLYVRPTMIGTEVLRVQSCSGRFVVDGLTQDSTLWTLQKVLEEKTTVHPDRQKILFGYPPKELPDYNPLLTLESLGIKSGDTVTLEELKSERQRTIEFKDVNKTQPNTSDITSSTSTNASNNSNKEKKSNDNDVMILNSTEGNTGAGHSVLSGTKRELDHTSETEPSSSQKRSGKLSRKVVPADNSCLFKSISILLCNNADTSKELRELAAGIIISNPDKYSTVLLGKTNQEYTQWLLREQSWGGGIELTVFSNHFKVELDVVDIQSQRVDRFGEGDKFERRALLLYDGIHYDPLVFIDGSGTTLQTTFPTSNEAVLFEALDIARQAHKARQYTDVAKFSLRCLVCSTALTGHADAQAHAKKTGHVNFGEI